MRPSVEVARNFAPLTIYDAGICDRILPSWVVSFSVVEGLSCSSGLHRLEGPSTGFIKCWIVVGLASNYSKGSVGTGVNDRKGLAAIAFRSDHAN
jgi:hypothetical protein